MDQGVVVPFPLTQRRHMAPFARGTWEPSLAAGSQYKIGDLVTTNGATQGSVEKVVETTTATNITKIAAAGQDYDLGADFEPGGRYEYYAARDVPLNLIDPTDEWVFTLAGTFDAAAAAAVAGARNAKSSTTLRKEHLRFGLVRRTPMSRCVVFGLVQLGIRTPGWLSTSSLGPCSERLAGRSRFLKG